jgi:hypothetical protein
LREESKLLPLAHALIQKACEKARDSETGSCSPDEIRKMADDLIYEGEDPVIKKEVADLIQDLREEPRPIVSLRATIRPLITLFLTLTFIFLTVGRVTGVEIVCGADDATWDKMFSIFLAIYGPVIGFWFGQRTALKTTATR